MPFTPLRLLDEILAAMILGHLGQLGLPMSILLGSCGLMVLLMVLPSGAAWSSLLSKPSSSGCARVGNHTEEYNPAQYMTGVIFRSGNPTWEGYGSWFQHYKGSIVAAMYLKKTLIFLDDVPSSHGYYVSPQVNAVHARPGMPSNASSDACVHKNNWGPPGSPVLEAHLIRLMCLRLSPKAFNTPTAMFTALGPQLNETAKIMAAERDLAYWTSKYAACAEIRSIHRKGVLENYNDCIQPWLSYTLLGMFANRGYTSVLAENACLNVGIHIRWGDVAQKSLTTLGGRNMRGEQIVYTLQNFKNITSQCFNYYIFAKDATPGLTDQFQIEHTLVDGDDDLFDMYLYSLMDVYIQGVSSWSVMPTYVHSGRVLITDKPTHPKLQTNYRDVNYIYHYEDLTYVDHIARLRPMSAERAAKSAIDPGARLSDA